jgi:hypothetical protein
MKDYQAQVEKLRKDAAECALIRDLATDQAKREMFDRLGNASRSPCRTTFGGKSKEAWKVDKLYFAGDSQQLGSRMTMEVS